MPAETRSLSPADIRSAEAAAGIPPRPAGGIAAAYIADLEEINPAIVAGHDSEVIVDRGRDVCSMVGSVSAARLVGYTNEEFTAPGHPDGFGMATAQRILAATQKRLCGVN